MDSATHAMETVNDLNIVSDYLARRDIDELTIDKLGGRADVIVLLGSGAIGSAELAASALLSGAAEQLVISGGIGHSTQALYDNIKHHPQFCDLTTDGRGEADIFKDIVTQLGVEDSRIIVENRSTNCGSNAQESRKILDALGIPLRRMVLLQDPTMQRRTQACFERTWHDVPDVSILSFAPFIPRVRRSPDGQPALSENDEMVWQFDRFVSLIMGEIPRLRDDENGYGPKGRNFYDHVEIPARVLKSYHNITIQFAHLLREIPHGL